MVPKLYIKEWKKEVIWNGYSNVEQDLIISRALVAIFSDNFLKENLAIRGGTALHKLYFKPALRYSEDIDLVQINSGPIKPIMERLNRVVNFFEKPRTTKISGHSAKAFYRYESEYDNDPMRLKIEINTKEHLNLLEPVYIPFEIKNSWFSGESLVRTYNINELLGSKITALFQRRKGRDLFDLYYANHYLDVDFKKMLDCFKQYTKFSINKLFTKKQLLIDLEKKQQSKSFQNDMQDLIHPKMCYDQKKALNWIIELISEEYEIRQ